MLQFIITLFSEKPESYNQHKCVKCETLNPGKRVTQKAFNQTKHIHSAHFLTLIRYPNYSDQGQTNFTDVIGKFSDQYRVTV